MSTKDVILYALSAPPRWPKMTVARMKPCRLLGPVTLGVLLAVDEHMSTNRRENAPVQIGAVISLLTGGEARPLSSRIVVITRYKSGVTRHTLPHSASLT